MDIKPSSSTIAALGQQGGQQAQKTNDLTKAIPRKGSPADEQAAKLRGKKTTKIQRSTRSELIAGAHKASSKMEIQAAQSRVESLTTQPEFRREAPLAIAGPPQFQKLGQIVDILV